MQHYSTVFKQSFQTTTCMVQIIVLHVQLCNVRQRASKYIFIFTQTQLKQSPTPMEVLVLLLVCYHSSDNKLSTVRLVAYLIMCYEWLLDKKWLFCVCEDPRFPSAFSIVILAPKNKQTHAHVSWSRHHTDFLSRGIKYPSLFQYISLPSLPMVLPNTSTNVRRNACFPFLVAFAPGLEVNHGGLGQVFSSLENSLHMTHFRYPQILRANKDSN